MVTRVLITIDTELAWRHFARGAPWPEQLALSYDPAGVGVRYQLAMLERCGLKACFFVDPMPALVYGLEPIRAMVEPILAAGQEVQLHLHSFWWDLARGEREAARFELTQFDAAGQQQLVEVARDLLIEAGAPPPIAFRSGSYAANADTLAALRRLGLAYDSSHNGAEHPWPSALPVAPRLIDPAACAGVTEIPVSQIAGRGGALRPFQICALSAEEMRAALNHAGEQGHPLVTIVGHSFELASRDGRRVNRLVRGRFDRLCAFLAAHAAALPTVTFADLPALVRDAASEPLPPRRLRTVRRLAEQAWGNLRYERPRAAAAVAAAAAPLGGLIYGLSRAGF